MMRRFTRTHDSYCEIRIRLISWAVLLAIIAILMDMFSDYFGWVNRTHLLLEGVAIALLSSLLICLLRLLIAFRADTVNWHKRADNAELDAGKWKHEVNKSLKGLSDAIEQQFNKWEFTKAEKEIGRLMLKGMMFKDIAHIRYTSERTVRQQALGIYIKSGMRGRSEFSAYFLEDLIFP